MLHWGRAKHHHWFPVWPPCSKCFLIFPLPVSSSTVPLPATLLSLSAKSQVALAGLCFAVEWVCEDSHNADTARMNRNRVRFFEEDFCQQHGITDTCMLNVESYQEATLIFAMFATFLALSHTLLCKTIKSVTISNYLHAVASHVSQARWCMPNPNLTLWWHNPRINLSTGKIDNKINQVLKEVKCWESMPNCCEPLTIIMVL